MDVLEDYLVKNRDAMFKACFRVFDDDNSGEVLAVCSVAGGQGQAGLRGDCIGVAPSL